LAECLSGSPATSCGDEGDPVCVLFEPLGKVKGNEEFKVAADRMIEIIVAQLKTLKTKKSDG
jgi:hypothetical protein